MLRSLPGWTAHRTSVFTAKGSRIGAFVQLTFLTPLLGARRPQRSKLQTSVRGAGPAPAAPAADWPSVWSRGEVGKVVVALGAPRAVSGLPRPPSAPGGRCLDLLWRCGVWGGVGGWTEDGWAGAGGGQADCRRACSRPSTALATSSPLLPDLPQLPEQGKQAEAMPRSRGTAPPARGAPGRAAACPGNVRRTPRPRRRIHPRVARRPSPARRHLRWSPSEQLEVTRVEGEHSLLVRAPRASLRGRASRQQRPPALLRTARGEPAGWPGGHSGFPQEGFARSRGKGGAGAGRVAEGLLVRRARWGRGRDPQTQPLAGAPPHPSPHTLNAGPQKGVSA